MRALFLCFLLVLGNRIIAQDAFVEGVILDGNMPLHGAHIQNISEKKLTSSAPNGFFTIPSQVGDSLIISYIGYEDTVLITDLAMLTKKPAIQLIKNKIFLDEVVITPFPDYWDFKQLILDTEPPADTVIKYNLPVVSLDHFYDPRSEPIAPSLSNGATVGIGFDLTGLTKKGKEKKKLIAKLKEKDLWEKAHQKFNRDWVSSVTKLEGDELTDFIDYCNFSPEYIIETPHYELHHKVMALLEDFHLSKSDEKITSES